MTSHTGFVLASYGAAIIVLAALIGWIFIDQRSQRQALQELESRGVRRRSETKMDNAS
ncbi:MULTISPECIES: heme exporter protein CcmD [Phyllobacterium]|jgi:heme exporter protein D|uniref:Heme exporter protein CcmD n=1 Tax=Phyllobacterium zundukense TaxID=1867719 RepID=A0ACD4D828_9HYPH|nr:MULTISPECIES: heme exporter protein CcmD [Phyllobacterium]MDR6631726.1 heme exporter protein D [Phyllobacterium sp. 1468]UXN61929.1 heme exporter protein CcmD [Phyllobacterium zundukense]